MEDCAGLGVAVEHEDFEGLAGRRHGGGGCGGVGGDGGEDGGFDGGG